MIINILFRFNYFQLWFCNCCGCCCCATFAAIIVTVIIAALYFCCLELMAQSHVTNLKHQSLHKIWSLKCNWAKSGQTLTSGSDPAEQSDHFRSGFIFDIKLAGETQRRESHISVTQPYLGWILMEYEYDNKIEILFLPHLIDTEVVVVIGALEAVVPWPAALGAAARAGNV